MPGINGVPHHESEDTPVNEKRMNSEHSVLRCFSDNELEQELKRRQQAKTAPAAIPMDQVDWSDVYKSATNHFAFCHSNAYHEDDDEAQYTFEAAMKAVYGPKVFEYLNKIVP